MWHWFCRLGREKDASWKPPSGVKGVPEKISESGADVCTRLCGQEGCGCGGTMRGRYCIWSYYRMD